MPTDNMTPQTSQPSQAAEVVRPLTGLTKRQQLENANKNIFVWVAIASAVLALSAVALQFLVREAMFNQKIISAQRTTNKTLEQSKENFSVLKSDVDELLADSSLAGLRVNPQDNSLQVVLDALPTSGDATSFSNSLYTKVLVGRSVSVNGISVGDLTGAAATAVMPTAPVTPVEGGVQPLPFNVGFTGNQQQVHGTIIDLEKVIRPIKLSQLSAQVEGGALKLNVTGETYYLPRSSISLGKESITP